MIITLRRLNSESDRCEQLKLLLRHSLASMIVDHGREPSLILFLVYKDFISDNQYYKEVQLLTLIILAAEVSHSSTRRL